MSILPTGQRVLNLKSVQPLVISASGRDPGPVDGVTPAVHPRKRAERTEYDNPHWPRRQDRSGGNGRNRRAGEGWTRSTRPASCRLGNRLASVLSYGFRCVLNAVLFQNCP